jgi:hypothetical protein
MPRAKSHTRVLTMTLGRLALALGLAALGAFWLAPAAMASNTLTVAVSTPNPEQGFPVTVTFSGQADPVDQYGNGPDIYATERPVSAGISCQASYGLDEAAAGDQNNDLTYPQNVNPGNYNFGETFNPDNGSYQVCAWEENGLDGSGTADTPGLVLAGPVSVTVNVAQPQVSGLTVTAPANLEPNRAFQVKYAVTTDQNLELDTVVQPAAYGCRSTYEMDTANPNQTLIGSQNDSLNSGPSSIIAPFTVTSRGAWLICTWVEGPNDSEVDSGPLSTPISVGAQPPASSPPASPHPATKAACVVPRYGGVTLATVKSRLERGHCRVGRITRRRDRHVRRGRVIKLSARPGRRLRVHTKIAITLSSG